MKHRRYSFNQMNLKFYILFFICITLRAQPDIPSLRYYANDFTGTLSQSELQTINSDLESFDKQTTNQVVLLIINSLGGYPLEMYAHETAEKNKIGTKDNNNGVLLLIVMKDKKIRIEVGYGLEGALPDALASSIIRNEIAPGFKRGNFYEGISAGLKAIKSATVGEYKRKDKEQDEGEEGIGFPFIYIIIFILIIIFSRGKRGGGLLPWLLIGSMTGGRSRGGFGGGGFDSGGGFGGFSGGGGSFGGGGASGGW